LNRSRFWQIKLINTALLISDLHLSEDTPEIEQGLYRLLDAQQAGTDVYILGDFFEAWVGDDDDAPLATRVQSALKALTDKGCALYLQRGNRDFMLGQAFAESVGAELLGESVVMTLGGQPTLLMHGDTLCTDDTDYLQFRSLVHDPAWQQDMLAKPLDERRALAQQLRSLSIDAASNKAEDIMDVNETSVADTMVAAGVKRLIHGHTHRPRRHQYDHGERIVLGDWTAARGWCVKIAVNGDCDLESFDLG
jgi:UDP-2,3-diacylglucosamine hydrolase